MKVNWRHKALFACLAAALFGGCMSEKRKLTEQGQAEYKAGNYAAAETTFDRVLDSDQSNAEANYWAGMAAFQQQKYEVAKYHLKLAWQFDPSMGDVKDALTETMIRSGGSTDEALDFLERDAELTAKQMDPRMQKNNPKRPYKYQIEEGMYLTKAGTRLRVAKVYERIGDLDNAAINYEKARELGPDSPGILMAVAEFYVRIGQVDKGAKAYEKAYNIDPKYPGLAESITNNKMVVK